MRARTLLRVAMLGLAAAVSLVVYSQWRPSAAPGETTEAHPELSIRPRGDARAAESATYGLNFRKSKEGRDVLEIRAREHLDFVDGWNEWSGPDVKIHGREPGNEVRILAERMRTTGEMQDPDEVRLLGDVVATLPKGGTFTSNRVDFDAVTGLVSTCRRSTLLYAGLEVRSDCLEFQTEGDVTRGDGLVAETLRMWGDLGIQSAAQESRLPAGLAGSADEMQFRPGGERVFLNGNPRLNFVGTSVRGEAIELDMNLDTNELRSIDARGQGRMRYDPDASPITPTVGSDDPAETGEASATSVDSPSVAAPSGDAAPSPAALTLRADRFQVSFAGGAEIGEILALSETGEAAALTVGERGRLTADEIVLTPTEDRQRVAASGSVTWSSSGKGDLGDLTAATLELVIAAGELRRLEATGQVSAEIASADEQRRFTGRRLSLQWADGELVEGAWPEGARFNADGRNVVAGAARYEPSTGTWRLSGPPVPTVSDAALRMSAARMDVGLLGGVEASESVDLQLGGDLLAAAGPLFGTATAVDVRAGQARMSDLGVLTLENRVEVIWQEQSLVAGRLRIETSPGRLQASDNVELVVVRSDQDDAATDPPATNTGVPIPAEDTADPPAGAASRFITVSAANLLVEEESAEIRLAGGALLRHGVRRIRATRLVVQLDENGAWKTIRAEEEVQFRDAEATASGLAMTYELDSGAFVLEGSDELPATFVYDGIQYHSNDALGVRFQGEQVTISTRQDGRTQTRVVPRQESAQR